MGDRTGRNQTNLEKDDGGMTESPAHEGERTAAEVVASSPSVYVGNLDWSVTEEEVANHMLHHGFSVQNVSIMVHRSGRSKGCALVQFESAETAGKAIQTINKSKLRGRNIFMRVDREAIQPTTSPETVLSSPTSPGISGVSSVYVGNLSYRVAWQDLKDHMSAAGLVEFARVLTDKDGRSKGCGIVHYETAESAQRAVETLNNTSLMGRKIFVREDREANREGSGSITPPGVNFTVYVWNLPRHIAWQELKDFMRFAGNVDSATILPPHPGHLGGRAIVKYQKHFEANRSIRELNGAFFGQNPIYVQAELNELGQYSLAQAPYLGVEGRAVASTIRGQKATYENFSATFVERAGKLGKEDMERDGIRGEKLGREQVLREGEEVGETGMMGMKGNIKGGRTDDIVRVINAGNRCVLVKNLPRNASVFALKEHFGICGAIDGAEILLKDCVSIGRVLFKSESSAQKAVSSLTGTTLDGERLVITFDNNT